MSKEQVEIWHRWLIRSSFGGKESIVHPGVLIGGFAALDAVLGGELLYAARRDRRRGISGDASRKRVVTRWPTYRRPVPRKRNNRDD